VTVRPTGPGPLAGLRVVEMAGLAPGPFCAMVLADLGAEVVTVDRAAWVRGDGEAPDTLRRGRRSIAVDLKHPDGPAVVLRLLEEADVFIEGFRPGVMERLGLGPDVCLAANPALVYGRMTGWGQDGPLAPVAGHDIDYIAVAGALHPMGRAGEPPVPPLNLLGDFGGGGMLLAVGILAALFERRTSGRGQVVDAAMVDGAALLMTMIHEQRAQGFWRPERGANYIDTGGHFYDTYETADGRYVAIGAIEDQFYARLLEALGLDREDLPDQWDRSRWPELRERFAAVFRSRTRDEWCRLLEGTETCFAPVLDLEEAPRHPHLVARQTFMELDGAVVPAPAPRFGRTPGPAPMPGPKAGEHTDEVLATAGYPTEAIQRMREDGTVA
jgi:alpha-methylacyl-CoA racemase